MKKQTKIFLDDQEKHYFLNILIKTFNRDK